ncbi:MAG TPA: prolyl oligopeptidase family serine peptidase [Actinomycetota bacterium]|nr:prolyl oligopeptidase family serine peptidase [Actinomycetota bacterium]
MSGRESFPRQAARTRNFTLGLPRTFTVASDGSRVVFLRSPAGDDPNTEMWVFDVAEASERRVAQAHEAAKGRGDEPPEERARRERARERAEGIVAYSTDRACSKAVFEVGGSLYLADLAPDRSLYQRHPATEPVFDPRIDPMGRRVAYVSGGALRFIGLDGPGLLTQAHEDRVLVEEPGASWGLAEFVAAEEMNRYHGFWWSPDGDRLAVTRVDESSVQVWHIADPANPAAAPVVVRYPTAGTTNADVRLFIIGLNGSRTEVQWDRQRFEYLCRVWWSDGRPLTIVVQSRDQRNVRTLTVSDDGSTETVREQRDEAWVDLIDGSPAWLADGRLVSTRDGDDTRRLLVGDEPVTAPGLQVHGIVDVSDRVIFTASDDPETAHVWMWSPDEGAARLTEGPGVHAVEAADDVAVITSSTVDASPRSRVRRGDAVLAELRSNAEEPVLHAAPTFLRAGARELRTALLLPNGSEPDEPLPVLLDPYGGPLHQRVVRSRDRYLESQWFADQGFAVLVADGRGTPGRGPAWEREIHRNVLGPVLQDQVDALHAAAERFDFLDLSRVAMRGWSFGGELSAAAVLRRPDVFHAAVVGAPVTDPRLYDTHYTERYLGHPDDDPEAYRRNSLLGDAPNLERPMLIIHGLADDNVVVANSLRLSRALLEAGRPHMFLPLSGITHMAAAEEVAENLLLLELNFLRDALGLS